MPPRRAGRAFRCLRRVGTGSVSLRALLVERLPQFRQSSDLNRLWTRCRDRQIVEPGSHGYSPPMPDKLNALLERLKAQKRTLIPAMAEHDGLPAGSALRRVAELENVIAAVEAVAAEEVDRARRS